MGRFCQGYNRRLFFRIVTFQWVMSDSNKKISPQSRLLRQSVSAASLPISHKSFLPIGTLARQSATECGTREDHNLTFCFVQENVTKFANSLTLLSGQEVAQAENSSGHFQAASRALSLGDAKSRNARTLIGKKRSDGYTRLTGAAGGVLSVVA